MDSVEKVISFNHAYCRDALSQMADEFETEWEVEGKTIHLRKAEHFKDNPLPMSYGRGNGFLPGLGRANFDNSKPVEILFVQGGDRNIDPSKYGSRELLLPKNQTLAYGGRQYISDEQGFSIRRADKALQSYEEDSLDCSHIYPSRAGEVSAVRVPNADKNFYDFIDSSIPADLDFTKYLTQGETLTVIFQSGMLVGRELEVKYIHKDRRFEIVPQEIDGQIMPNDVFKPAVGDRYAVFGMNLPNEYVCDNATQSGASWDMFREAAKYLYEHEEQKFSFTGEMDGIWAKKDWINIGGRIKVGGYILFSDAQFQPEGVPIRIVGVKDYVNNPYKPQIEISNSPVGGTVASVLKKIAVNEVVTEEYHKDALQFTKRRFRDAKETMSMLEGALLNSFSQSISPITVQTMAMLVGDKSLQFRFVNGKTNPQQVQHNVTYNIDSKVLNVPAGMLQHMTLGIDTISSSHKPGEYKFWSLPEFNTPPLEDGDKKYYLYAKVSKAAEVGAFYISETAIAMEAVAGYYHLLMGVLNSEFDGERSYVSLYGFTEVLPGQVTTDRIVSGDGKSFFDLVANKFRVGNEQSYIDWNNAILSTLSTINMRLKNATIENKLEVINEALLAGFLFSNEVIKSNSSSGNTPYITLDGKTGAASFVAGMIEFNKTLAKIGQFTVEAGRLVGYVNGSEERVRLTTDDLGTLAQMVAQTTLFLETPSWEFSLNDVNRWMHQGITKNVYLKAGESIGIRYGGYADVRSGALAGGSSSCKFMQGSQVLASDSDQMNDISYTVQATGTYTVEYAESINVGGGERDYAQGTFRGYLNCVKTTAAQKSIIARNGIASVWSNAKSFFLSADDIAWFLRVQGKIALYSPNGQYGVEVTDDGIALKGLKTMAAGVASGHLYNSGGTIKIA